MVDKFLKQCSCKKCSIEYLDVVEQSERSYCDSCRWALHLSGAKRPHNEVLRSMGLPPENNFDIRQDAEYIPHVLNVWQLPEVSDSASQEPPRRYVPTIMYFMHVEAKIKQLPFSLN